MKMKNQVVIGEGQPIKNEKDIVKFLKYMSKKYTIIQEKGVVDMIVTDYKKSPKGKDHLVMSNRGNEWFMNFLSNEEVVDMIEIEKNTKVFSK